MFKFKNLFFCLAALFLFVFGASSVYAMDSLSQKNFEINFFYSATCPHCLAEQKFLDKIEAEYSEVKVSRYLFDDSRNQKLLRDLSKEHGAERYLGLVPLTFAGEDFFVGFDNPEGIGREIEASIQRQTAEAKTSLKPEQKRKIKIPFIGERDLSQYSLPVQAIVLGFFDGFNICSLGALVLILGLVLALRSRKKILIFGGIYILTTAIVYGLLIVLWYKLFSLLASYLRLLEILIGLLGIGAGVYFLKQFLKFRKQGPFCEMSLGKRIMSIFSRRMQPSFDGSGNIIFLALSVLAFAVIITLVEFPCSAALPVFFAGTLAKANLSTLAYLTYIMVFLFFYLLDEIIVFLLAIFKLKIWLESGKFATWIALVEAIVLFGLGGYYLFW